MAEPPDARGHPGGETGTPRWVKVSGIIALVLLLLVVIVMLAGDGGHGPGRHTPSGDAGGSTPLSSITALDGNLPPFGGHW